MKERPRKCLRARSKRTDKKSRRQNFWNIESWRRVWRQAALCLVLTKDCDRHRTSDLSILRHLADAVSIRQRMSAYVSVCTCDGGDLRYRYMRRCMLSNDCDRHRTRGTQRRIYLYLRSREERFGDVSGVVKASSVISGHPAILRL